MIPATEHLSQVAQFIAAGDAETPDLNTARLESWRRRYPHDVVDVPETSQPPQWPASRSSLAEPATVTQLQTKARGQR